MSVMLDKVEAKAPQLLNLAKTAETALSKKQLVGSKAKVALVLDYSGSMRKRYSSGEVQGLAEKALSLAAHLDDDGAIDVFCFDTTATYLGELSLDNYRGGIDRLLSGRRMGTTDYAGAFREVVKHFFGSVKKGLFKKAALSASAQDMPVYAIFVTDGVPNSRSEASKEMAKASEYPVFWKFLSVGNEAIPFLQKLDDMEGRKIDNADYKPMGEVSRFSDEEFYDALLDEYPEYISLAKNAGILN